MRNRHEGQPPTVTNGNQRLQRYILSRRRETTKMEWNAVGKNNFFGHLTNRVDLIDLPNYEQKFTNVEGVIG